MKNSLEEGHYRPLDGNAVVSGWSNALASNGLRPFVPSVSGVSPEYAYCPRRQGEGPGKRSLTRSFLIKSGKNVLLSYGTAGRGWVLSAT